MLAAVSARSEAQVTRLALTYALVDGADAIGVSHLSAAREVWRYALDSARYIFGDNTGNRHADVLRGLLEDGEMTRSEARRELGLKTAADMDEVIGVLLALNLAELAERPHPTGGRAVQIIRSKVSKVPKVPGDPQTPERGTLT